MKTEQQYEAVAPFTSGENGGVIDADGDDVMVCDNVLFPEDPRCTFYKAKFIDEDAHFICPKCGRLGLRMDDAGEADLKRLVKS